VQRISVNEEAVGITLDSLPTSWALMFWHNSAARYRLLLRVGHAGNSDLLALLLYFSLPP
jgi:hypothetical protein